jgi:hypothetical protein
VALHKQAPWVSEGASHQALFSHDCSTTLLGSWKPAPGKQSPELPLLAGFVLSCLQQLLWILEAHTLAKVDSRAATALQAAENSSLLALLPHGHPQLATLCQEPTTTYANEPKAHCFAILLVPGGFPPYGARRPSASHHTTNE